MIGELLLFGSLASVVLIPLIGDNPNDVLGEAAERMRRERASLPRERHVLAPDDLSRGLGPS